MKATRIPTLACTHVNVKCTCINVTYSNWTECNGLYLNVYNVVCMCLVSNFHDSCALALLLCTATLIMTTPMNPSRFQTIRTNQCQTLLVMTSTAPSFQQLPSHSERQTIANQCYHWLLLFSLYYFITRCVNIMRTLRNTVWSGGWATTKEHQQLVENGDTFADKPHSILSAKGSGNIAVAGDAP